MICDLHRLEADLFPDFFNSKNTEKFRFYEKDGSFQLEIQAPDYEKDELDVSVSDGELIVKAENKKESNWANGLNVRFNLTDKMDLSELDAELKNGVLKIKIGKQNAFEKSIRVR